MSSKGNNYQASAPMEQGAPPPTYGDPAVHYVSNVVGPASFGPYPMRVTCSFCESQVVTQTEYVPGSLTYILSVVLCIFTCCCCLPFCFNKCKDIEHSCPACHRKLGLYKKM